MNIKTILSYDGTDFLGWQESIDGDTIEKTLRKTLETIYQHPIRLQAASRTDRGVHAENQVVNFIVEKSLDISRLKISLNQMLPKAIRILTIEEASKTFHPTLDAKGKEYHYSLCITPVQSPFRRYFSWHLLSPLDIDCMKEGTDFFIGTHDFKAFSNAIDSKRKDMFCTLTRLDIIEDGSYLRFEIEGNRFLYKMVRNLVGTLVYLGMGKLSLDEVKNLLVKKDRTLAGITAPAHGLTLKKVYYS
ncbi:MAG: tRNA pseudouridine(38-40) synthase TruA [Candidatus Neptunochlamydia sp.]|nr:tRNA pseudouridine(38-40) synthase TruA [Candidatus Neptunochlamydia sp.]